MSLARVLSRTQLGLDAPLVQVELDVGRGLPGFSIVGLPAPVVRESRERVRAALLNSGYEWPAGKITVNLAPVEMEKQGSRFDLPIALGVLIAHGQIPPPRRSFECYGELGLSGTLRPVAGLFLAALCAHAARNPIIFPTDNGMDAALSGHVAAYPARTLREAVALLHDPGRPLASQQIAAQAATAPANGTPSLADVIGQGNAKRALQVAAAGGHSLLMVGAPGSGKSMLAARLPGLLPPMSNGDALEVAGLASLAGLPLDVRRWNMPPFRSPHHTSSSNAIVGGGAGAKPGEISLAHRGVLFLDELPEFDRRVLESLREPMETGTITVARAGASVELPAQFQLVAAMNPCPCGYWGDARESCRCTPAIIRRYRHRISGPLLDRIDIRIVVPRTPEEELAAAIGELLSGSVSSWESGSEKAADVTERVRAARERRVACSGAINARLSPTQLQRCCALTTAAKEALRCGCQQLRLSGRGVHRVLALSRTIADLEASDTISERHVREAVQYRTYWANDTM